MRPLVLNLSFSKKRNPRNYLIFICVYCITVNYKVANLAENDPTITTVEKAQKRASLLLEVTAVTTANSVVTTFSNGSLFPSLGHQNERSSAATGVQLDPVLGKKICISFSKDKSPEVPFHRITLSYSYFEEFEFFRQFRNLPNMIKKKYQLNRTEKIVDKAHQFLHIKPKFKFAVE